MALTWDLTEIPDSETVCFLPDKLDPDGTIHPDRVKMNPITEVLIWATISVGISKITEKNYTDFYRRLRALEQLGICFLQGKDEDGKDISRNPNLNEVYLHMGLTTNAPKITNVKFLRNLGETVNDKIKFQVEEEIEEFNNENNSEEPLSA